MNTLETVLLRLASNPDLRAEFERDPEAVLVGYELTESERRLLVKSRSLLVHTPHALLTRLLLEIPPDGPIWWDSMTPVHAEGA